MFVLSSLFSLTAFAQVPEHCIDVEIEFQHFAREADEAVLAQMGAVAESEAGYWMVEMLDSMGHHQEEINEDRRALQEELAAGWTEELELALMSLNEAEQELRWHMSIMEHRVTGLEGDLQAATVRADQARDRAARMESRLNRCIAAGPITGGSPAVN